MDETGTPEGRFIELRMSSLKGRLSQREAAKRAGISEGRWRQVQKGYQSAGGQKIPVVAPADTLARMAEVVGMTPDDLEACGRLDAAERLREEGASKRRHPSRLGGWEASDSSLARVPDDVLIAELAGRMERYRAEAGRVINRVREEGERGGDAAPIRPAGTDPAPENVTRLPRAARSTPQHERAEREADLADREWTPGPDPDGPEGGA